MAVAPLPCMSKKKNTSSLRTQVKSPKLLNRPRCDTEPYESSISSRRVDSNSCALTLSKNSPADFLKEAASVVPRTRARHTVRQSIAKGMGRTQPVELKAQKLMDVLELRKTDNKHDCVNHVRRATMPDMNFLLQNMSFQKVSHLTKRQDSYNICDSRENLQKYICFLLIITFE